MGDFFSGGAQRLPAVRRGEIGNWARREPRFFVTAASGGVHGKIEEQPIHHSKLLFLALIAVLDSSGLLELVAPRRLFKLRGQLCKNYS